MKQISTTHEVQGVHTAGPIPAAASNTRLWAPTGGARPIGAPAYAAPASGSSLAEHARKQTGMARIDATGWPPGSQDRSSA